MSDKEYIFTFSFWGLVVILAVGIWLRQPWLVGLVVPFLVIVISTK